MNRINVEVDDLPELPFEQVLSYLSLSDLIKSRAVSRLWRDRIDNFRVRSLCYSDRPSGFVYEKSRLIRGAFDQNFISSTRFASFFNTFGSTILSGLKRLRLYDVRLSEDGTALIETLNSFGRLEALDIIDLSCSSAANPEGQFQLNLPMPNSIQLEEVYGISQLTVNAPRLKEVRLEQCPKVSFVHVESVEKLIASKSTWTAIEQLKNLKFLHVQAFAKVDPSLLSGLNQLNQLKEIHLKFANNLRNLFDQKQRHGRTDLKIYLCGCLLNGPSDPAISSLCSPKREEFLVHLASNPSKLADKIVFEHSFHYSIIERIAPELATSFLKRFIDLKLIIVNEAVQDVQRFVDLLKSLDNIVELKFCGDHPQELFDRLPEPSAIRKLEIQCEVSDFRFLFNLKNLMHLFIESIDIEFIQRALEELKFLSSFHFEYNGMLIEVDIQHPIGQPKEFYVWIDEIDEYTSTSDLTTAIQFIVESADEE